MCTTQPIKDTAQLKRFKEYYLLQKPNPRNHMLIVIGLNSALRISDILGLTYGDIYHYEKDAWKTHLTVTEQKTGKTNQIYINREIRETLEMYVTPPGKGARLLAVRQPDTGRAPLKPFPGLPHH